MFSTNNWRDEKINKMLPKISALCAPVPNRKTEAELRRRNEWFITLAGKGRTQ